MGEEDQTNQKSKPADVHIKHGAREQRGRQSKALADRRKRDREATAQRERETTAQRERTARAERRAELEREE